MNDTILNKRQEKILALIQAGGKLTRAQIIDELKQEWKKVAIITIARDLKYLVNKKFINTAGKARASVYFTKHISPLLKYIDLDSYFIDDVFVRKINHKFQKKVIKELCNIFNNKELAEFDRGMALFKNRTKAIDSVFFKRELERFIIEFSWKSSQIEGNTYDLLETEALIKEHIEAKGHSREETQMILNHKVAFDAIMQMKSQLKELTFAKIMQLHNVLVNKLGITTGIRTREVKIIGTAYIPPIRQEELNIYLREIINQINKTKHPAEKALIATCMIAYLQPFADGNKRTGRMLSNAILLAYNYFPLSYRSVDVIEYKKAMILFYEQNNLYHFKKIFMEQFQFALNNYFL
ncbi:MAG: Fic family protein [Candidatus Kuenenbacteria bacterium]